MQNGNKLTDAEIVSSRVFSYPKELVFQAWSNPDLLAKWWGPDGFTNSIHRFDFKEGGSWIFTMHGADGTDYNNEIVFAKIIKPELIVFEHLEPVHRFRVTASFDELDARTRLIFHMLFESVEECEKVRSYIIPANEQNFDRLEGVLSGMGACYQGIR